MGVAADIGTSLRHGPRAVVRRQLAQGPNEARALAFLMIGCFLVALAQLPALARDASAGVEGLLVTPLARGIPPEYRTLDVFLAYTVLSWLIIVPLVFFGLAILVHAVSRAFGGQGTPFGARLALFWSWLAASPLALVTGALAGFTGPSVITNLAGIFWIAVFGAFWWQAQREAAEAGQVQHGV